MAVAAAMVSADPIDRNGRLDFLEDQLNTHVNKIPNIR